MQHKGEIVEKAIRQSGYSITKLAKKLGKSTRWMYYMFQDINVPIDYVIEIGDIIHYDFSDEIKELKRYKAIGKKQEVEDPLSSYKTKNEEIEHWKSKYLELLETHNQLLSKLTTADKKSKSPKK